MSASGSRTHTRESPVSRIGSVGRRTSRRSGGTATRERRARTAVELLERRIAAEDGKLSRLQGEDGDPLGASGVHGGAAGHTTANRDPGGARRRARRIHRAEPTGFDADRSEFAKRWSMTSRAEAVHGFASRTLIKGNVASGSRSTSTEGDSKATRSRSSATVIPSRATWLRRLSEFNLASLAGDRGGREMTLVSGFRSALRRANP